ncbi:MAG: hypothetical protein HKN16_09955 [Saprospiraceae bacterium]|nr:hypothetical protein [Saprospiraceae bacterium]
MLNSEFQFLVDFKLPDYLSEDFMELIPYQRAMVNRLFKDGKMMNYALSLESSRLWCVINATTEDEVQGTIQELPLTKFMNFEICILTFYNSMEPVTPDFSMN